MKIGKRCFIRMICFSAAFFITAAVMCVLNCNIQKRYDLTRKNEFFFNIEELDGSIYSIGNALTKMSYCTSPLQMSTLSTELCAETSSAKNALARLPSENGADMLNDFLSKAGDFPLYLAKKSVKGETVTSDERESLEKLAKTAESISEKLGEIRNEYNNGNGIDALIKALDSGDFTVSLQGFDGLEQLLADYPTLLYDGPFSDHMLEISPKLTKDKPEISISEARAKAAKLLHTDGEKLTADEETVGNLPCYNFSDECCSVSVTKQGGYIVYFTKNREIGDITVDYETAVDIAVKALNDNSENDFTSTYYFADEGICTVNLACKAGDAVCYSDLIKLGVALDNGEIVSAECAGFIANHIERAETPHKYSVDEAREILSNSLSVISSKPTIIPLDGNKEEYCYEFLCDGKEGKELLVYVNADTCAEEKIMILLRTDGGTLTK